ncbi:MAG TPA: hypothetical protein VJ827_12970 [Rubrobacter sp.]|nr:hypothetical protein [Rubrobacter sp.]
MSAKSSDPIVNPHQVTAAGLASAGAALITSRFGVGGTLLGAALTAMIITGSSAILRAYLETASGRVRHMPNMFRSSRRDQEKAGGFGGEATMPGRPDLRDNFMGRMRAALDWFSHLPTLRRRSILMKGLVAAAIAFVICMGAVWGAEKLIGNSLSCGIWAECPYGAVPGIHPAGYDGTGAQPSIGGGGVDTGVDRPGLVDRVRQNPFGGDDQPVFGGDPGGAASSASPAPGGGQESAPSSAAPSSASPAAGGGQESASPAAQKQGAPSSASPAAGQ